MSRVRWVFLLFVLTSLTARSALAQDTKETRADDAAAEHFERGVTLFKEQAYRAAVVEFQRAYDLAPDYRLLYNLGRAKQQLQDYLGAAENYEAYLVQGGSEIALERRTQVEETLASLSNRVARLNVTVNRPGAEVFLDDVKVGVAPLDSLLRTNVGSHRVSARAEDGSTGAQIVDVAGGDIAEVNIKLAEPLRAVASRGSELPESAPRRPWTLKRKLALTGIVIGGSMLAASIATGVLALHDQSRLHDQVDTLGVSQSAVAKQRDKVDTLSLTTDVLIGAGAACAVLGTVLWLASKDRVEQKTSQRTTSRAGLKLDLGFGSLAVSSRF
jgi:hypothetical protein